MFDPSSSRPPTGFGLWWTAVRPRTLSLAVVPVLVGAALAVAEGGRLDGPVFLVTVATAIAIQAGTNLHNDAADFLRGGDRPDRLGPARVSARGWAPPGRVMRAAHLAFAVAALGGAALVWWGGGPILALGLAAIAAGYGYSGGPRPIAYGPFGEVFVFAFFGVAALAGTVYLQLGRVGPGALVLGAALGLIAAAVLMVNNARDRDADQRVGRRTLAVVLGPTGARIAYGAMMAGPFAIVAAGRDLLPAEAILWPIALAGPAAAWLAVRFWRAAPGPLFNALLAGTAQAQLLFGALLALGLLI